MNGLVGLFRLADDVIRGRASSSRFRQTTRLPVAGVLVMLIVCFGMFYGGVMGTYGGIDGHRMWQVVYSAAKVPSCSSPRSDSAFPAFSSSTRSWASGTISGTLSGR